MKTINPCHGFLMAGNILSSRDYGNAYQVNQDGFLTCAEMNGLAIVSDFELVTYNPIDDNDEEMEEFKTIMSQVFGTFELVDLENGGIMNFQLVEAQ